MHFSVRTYNPKSCVCNSSYTPWWILFKPIHSDQHDMEMTVKIEFYDAASFTWVISKFIIIIIPSGDACLCEKILSESFTWLHNHSSWQRAVYASMFYGHISSYDCIEHTLKSSITLLIAVVRTLEVFRATVVPLYTHVLNTNIDQTLVNSLYTDCWIVK